MMDFGKGTFYIFVFFNCNYHIRDYPNIPQFYSELLQWWSELREKSASEKDWVHVIGQLHDDDICLQLPEFISFLLCNLNLPIPLRRDIRLDKTLWERIFGRRCTTRA